MVFSELKPQERFYLVVNKTTEMVQHVKVPVDNLGGFVFNANRLYPGNTTYVYLAPDAEVKKSQ